MVARKSPLLEITIIIYLTLVRSGKYAAVFSKILLLLVCN